MGYVVLKQMHNVDALCMQSACKYSFVWQKQHNASISSVYAAKQLSVLFIDSKEKTLCLSIYLRICKTLKTWQMQTLQNIMLNVLAIAFRVESEHQ